MIIYILLTGKKIDFQYKHYFQVCQTFKFQCYVYLYGKFPKEHLSVVVSGFLKAFRSSHSYSKVYMRIYVLTETEIMAELKVS